MITGTTVVHKSAQSCWVHERYPVLLEPQLITKADLRSHVSLGDLRREVKQSVSVSLSVHTGLTARDEPRIRNQPVLVQLLPLCVTDPLKLARQSIDVLRQACLRPVRLRHMFILGERWAHDNQLSQTLKEYDTNDSYAELIILAQARLKYHRQRTNYWATWEHRSTYSRPFLRSLSPYDPPPISYSYVLGFRFLS